MNRWLLFLAVAMLLLLSASGCGKKDYVPDPNEPPPDFGDINEIKRVQPKRPAAQPAVPVKSD